MKDKVIFATGNEGKMKEIRMLLGDVDVEVLSLKDAGISLDVEENGVSFGENALIKARACAFRTGMLALADDSGLEIDALNGEPGIYSARYMGEDTSYHIKNRSLVERLSGVPEEERTARFVCAIAAVFEDGRCVTVREAAVEPDGTERLTEGIMEGRIGYEEKGVNGFGYDPIFYVPEYGITSGEMDAEQKNKASHRGKALKKMKDMLLAEGIWKSGR